MEENLQLQELLQLQKEILQLQKCAHVRVASTLRAKSFLCVLLPAREARSAPAGCPSWAGRALAHAATSRVARSRRAASKSEKIGTPNRHGSGTLVHETNNRSHVVSAIRRDR